MKRILIFTLLLLTAASASAQTTLDLTFKMGREYDIPHREFTLFHIPGLELTLPPATGITFKSTWWFDAFSGERFRTDLFFTQHTRLGKKFQIVTNAGAINYYTPFDDPKKERRTDWVASVEGKLRLKAWD